MAFKEHHCFSLACDVCGEELNHFDNDGTIHFESAREAVDAADGEDWHTTESGLAVCFTEDDAHREAAKAHCAQAEPGHRCWLMVDAENIAPAAASAEAVTS